MQATLSTTALGDLSRPPFASDLPPSFSTSGTAVLHSLCSTSLVSEFSVASERPFVTGQERLLAEGRGLAHDAGNLLGALRLYCGLLAQPGVLRAEHRHYAEELLLLSGRSGSLIHRLLEPQVPEPAPSAEHGWTAPSRAAAHGAEEDQDGVSLTGIVDSCRGLLNTLAGRVVAVLFEDGVQGYRARVPRESVERILINLTKNAAEASPEGETVTIRVRLVSGQMSSSQVSSGQASSFQARDGAVQLVLSVEDEGRGLSAAGAAVLTGEDRSPATGRRGLGLRVVRELVANSGGELRLRSASGCGTSIEIAWSARASVQEFLQPAQASPPGARRRKEVAGVRVSGYAWNGTLGRTTAEGAGLPAGRVSC